MSKEDAPSSKGLAPRRLVIVVQRFGSDIVGGAESHARLIAERLASTGLFRVEVWTTTSCDFRRWDNDLAPGETLESGLTVRRFPTVQRRARWLGIATAILRVKNRLESLFPKGASEAFEKLWYEGQGPLCPQLLEALAKEQSRVDSFLFFTYLYYPTALGLPLVADKACLVPTAHDEPALYTRTSRRLFQAARRLLVNSEAERQLLVGLDASLAAKIHIAGVGIDLSARGARASSGSNAEPYALYLGRIGRAKRLDQLLAAYASLRAAGKAPWQLWLAGTLDGDVDLSGIDGVRYLGVVDEAHKATLLGQAAFIVNPSQHESLSLLVLEAIAAGKPMLLSRACPIFRDYAQLLPTVLLYEEAADLGSQARTLLATDWQSEAARARLEAARAWLNARYSWSSVLTSYIHALS